MLQHLFLALFYVNILSIYVLPIGIEKEWSLIYRSGYAFANWGDVGDSLCAVTNY